MTNADTPSPDQTDEQHQDTQVTVTEERKSLMTDEDWDIVEMWSEDEDNQNGFTELTADELVQMFGMMQGLAATKN